MKRARVLALVGIVTLAVIAGLALKFSARTAEKATRSAPPPPWPAQAALGLRPTPPPGLTCDAPGRQPSSLVADSVRPPPLRGQPSLLQKAAATADAIVVGVATEQKAYWGTSEVGTRAIPNLEPITATRYRVEQAVKGPRTAWVEGLEWGAREGTLPTCDHLGYVLEGLELATAGHRYIVFLGLKPDGSYEGSERLVIANGKVYACGPRGPGGVVEQCQEEFGDLRELDGVPLGTFLARTDFRAGVATPGAGGRKT